MKTMNHKGYLGSIEVDTEANILYGKLLHIRDLVTYESESASGLEKEFISAIDDYLADCKAAGVEPDKPFKGQFNVRVSPELHRSLARAARGCGKSMNDYVSSVLVCHEQIGENGKVRQQNTHYLYVRGTRDESSDISVFRSASGGAPNLPGIRRQTSNPSITTIDWMGPRKRSKNYDKH